MIHFLFISASLDADIVFLMPANPHPHLENVSR